MLKIVVEIVGWFGALLILGAYGLQMMNRMTAGSPSYQWMNLVGAVSLIINSAWNGAFPSVFLNIIWLAIALIALLRRARVRAAGT